MNVSDMAKKTAALYHGCELEKTRLFCRTRKNYITELKLAKIGRTRIKIDQARSPEM